MKKYLLPVIVELLKVAQDCSDEKHAKDLVLMAQKHLNSVAGELDKSIECVRSIYENDGFIPAIKEWRALTNKGLKDAKEDVERAADGGGWKYHLIGKIMRINSISNYLHGSICVVASAVRGASNCEVVLKNDDARINIPITHLTEVR